MRPNKPKPVDRSGYLANLIYEIIEGIRMPRHYHEKGETSWAVFALAAGESLWWHADTRRLMAMRANAPLQLDEEATFKAHIQKAGYGLKAGLKARGPVFVDGALNAWRGVVWVLADVEPAGVGQGEPMQEDLILVSHAPADILRLLAEVRRLQELNAGLISDLADMVNQHCTDNRDGFIYDGALSANEEAIDRLVDLQVLRKCPGHLIRYEWGPTAPA